MTESASSRPSEIGSAKKAKILHQAKPRTPKPKPKPNQRDFDEFESGPRATPVLEDSCTTPVIIPRKRRLFKETPTKSRKKEKRVDSEPEDIFRGKISVKIPAWMTETLKTIPSFPSPKRDRESRRQEEMAEGGGGGSLAAEQSMLKRGTDQRETLAMGVPGKDAQSNTNISSDRPLDLEVGKINSSQGEISSNAPPIICLDQQTSLPEEVEEHFPCMTGSPVVNSNGGAEDGKTFRERSEVEDEAEGARQSEGVGGDEVDQDGGGVQQQQVEFGVVKEDGGRNPPPYQEGPDDVEIGNKITSSLDVSSEQGRSCQDTGDIQHELLESTGDSTHPQVPKEPVRDIIIISDDESEGGSGTEDMHPLSQDRPPTTAHSPKGTRIQHRTDGLLTPDSLSPPGSTTQHQSSPLRPPNGVLGIGGPSPTMVNRSRWRDPRKRVQTRFSGPLIFTPLTLHPAEPGMGLIDKSHYPQHRGLWKKSAQELLSRFGELEKAKDKL